MYYVWICQTYYNGHLALPLAGESALMFLDRMAFHVKLGATPNLMTWVVYWAFIVFEGVLYVALPGGIWVRSPSNGSGRRMMYYCNAVPALYTTIAVALVLHFTGVFRLLYILDNFGPLMSVAILSALLVTGLTFAITVTHGKAHRMTGNWIYDFFMGAHLTPRIGATFDPQDVC